MLESVLKNNYFNFNGEVKQQLSGMALLIQHLHQYIPVYSWIKQTGFLVSQKNPKPLVWFCYIDDIIFICTHGVQTQNLHIQTQNLYMSKEKISLLELSVRLSIGKFHTDLHINPFAPNALFLYSLKASEKRTVIWCFQEVEKGCIEGEWVKATGCHQYLEYISFFQDLLRNH